MRKIIVALLGLIIVFTLVTAQPTLGAILLGNSFTPTNGKLVRTGQEVYMIFDVPAGNDYVISSLDTLLTGLTPSNTLNASIYVDNAGAPGALVGDLGDVVVTEDFDVDGCGAYTFTPAGTVTLSESTRYMIVMSYVSGAGVGAWCHQSFVPNVPTGIFTYVDTIVVGFGSQIEAVHFTLNGDVPVVPATVLNVPHVTDIRINSWEQVVAYGSPGGEPAKLANGQVIVLPHDFNNDGFDTYVVTDTATVDGVTWYSIFLGNESFTWVNGSQVTPIGP